VLTLHARASGASGAGPPVADVPSGIAVTKHTNAQAKAKELIINFVNFVFISIFYFLFLFRPSLTPRY